MLIQNLKYEEKKRKSNNGNYLTFKQNKQCFAQSVLMFCFNLYAISTNQ